MTNTLLLILSFLGFALSIYSFYVEKRLEKNKKYSPVCDLHDKISCKKNFTSSYAKSFSFSNSFIGIFFYLLLIILSYINIVNVIFYLSIPSLIFSIYLAYISFFKLKNFCILCSLIYIINILIAIFSYKIM